MKQKFIRGLWGIYDNSNKILQRRYRMDQDIQRILDNKFNTEFMTYVMGKENQRMLKEKGIESILIWDEPFKFDLVKHQYRHKLEIINHAMHNDNIEELIFLDWDCVPQKNVPDDFWGQMNKREKIQACLQSYRRRKCHWRQTDLRKVPNGGFVYLRDKDLATDSIEWWDKLGRQDNDEPSWAKMIDEMCGGWPGIDYYWEHFEAMFCNLWRDSAFDKNRLKEKDQCFVHYQG